MSGGLNSCVAACAARENYEIALLHVQFPHRSAKRSLRAFELQALALRAERVTIAPLTHFGQTGGSARMSRKLAIEDAQTLGLQIARTHTPGLMATMLGIAHTWAHTLGAERIIVGCVENPAPPLPPSRVIHPDTSREFAQIFNHLVELSDDGKRTCRVEAPLADLCAGDVVRLGRQLGAPLPLTWSCLRRNDEPCGTCYACAVRAQGFSEAGVEDEFDPATAPPQPGTEEAEPDPAPAGS